MEIIEILFPFIELANSSNRCATLIESKLITIMFLSRKPLA